MQHLLGKLRTLSRDEADILSYLQQDKFSTGPRFAVRSGVGELRTGAQVPALLTSLEELGVLVTQLFELWTLVEDTEAHVADVMERDWHSYPLADWASLHVAWEDQVAHLVSAFPDNECIDVIGTRLELCTQLDDAMHYMMQSSVTETHWKQLEDHLQLKLDGGYTRLKQLFTHGINACFVSYFSLSAVCSFRVYSIFTFCFLFYAYMY